MRSYSEPPALPGSTPDPNRLHAVDACLAALEMQAAVARTNTQRQKLRLPVLEVRIGLHAGPVIAGVVGKRSISYDIWGDTVNTAALVEEHGAPGRVNVSETVAGYVESMFDLEPRGTVESEKKGPLRMFWLNRLQAQYARDPEGRQPNAAFASERQRLLTGYGG